MKRGCFVREARAANRDTWRSKFVLNSVHVKTPKHSPYMQYKYSIRLCPILFMLHRPRTPAPSQCRRLLSLHRQWSRSFSDDSTGDGVANRASSKLFADAALEEETSQTTSSSSSSSSSKSSAKLLAQQQHPNWTGEESIQDAVLRMLVDKYKPLRGELRSADEKLKNAPPKVTRTEHDAGSLRVNEGDTTPDASKVKASESTSEAPPNLQSTLANEPILPGIEGHKPWHVTFKPPSHAISVKLGNITTSSSSAKTPLNIADQDHIAKAARDRSAKKRSEQAQRLTKAREETLDYKLGIKGSGKSGEGVRGRTNPVIMRGWATLVEERIAVRFRVSERDRRYISDHCCLSAPVRKGILLLSKGVASLWHERRLSTTRLSSVKSF